MKVLILGDANSVHITRWVLGLCKGGIQVGLWSLSYPKDKAYDGVSNIVVASPGIKQSRKGLLNKLGYLRSLKSYSKFLAAFCPDVIHAHYASSYGLLASLGGGHPLIISVWGSDVFDFPKKNILFKYILRKNLEQATCVLSTSHVMAKETARHTQKSILVTPFGIDLQKFDRNLYAKTDSGSEDFTIGTIKTLEEKYGLSYLIRGFAELRKRYPARRIKLLIVGGGSQESELKTLAKELGIDEHTTFTGFKPHTEIPFYHAKLDIAVFPSILDSESFGVSAVEASAMGTPVIASNVGGLPEVIRDGINGLIVPAKDWMAIADAMDKLYVNSDLRKAMAKAGMKIAETEYDWKKNLTQMIDIYQRILNK